MKAILLAAGRGSRLKPYTDTVPKSLLPIGDTSLIERTVGILQKAGVSDISIVVGYLKEAFFRTFPTGIKFYVNEDYLNTDQGGSLIRAKTEMNDDLLVIAADLLCPEGVFRDAIKHDAPICVAIDLKDRPFDDVTEKIVLKNGKIRMVGKTNVPNELANGEFLGMTKLSRKIAPLFTETLEQSLATNKKTQIVQVIQKLIDGGEDVAYVQCVDPWCEMDDPDVMKRAGEILSSYSA